MKSASIEAKLIRENLKQIAQGIIELQYKASGSSEFSSKSGLLQGIIYNLTYLAEAIEFSSPVLYRKNLLWVKDLMESHYVPREKFLASLEYTSSFLRESFPEIKSAVSFVDETIESLKTSRENMETFLIVDSKLADQAQQYTQALLQGKHYQACKIIMDEVNKGTVISDLYYYVFERSQHEIGLMWQRNIISVAQEHYCTATTQSIMAQLYPYIFTGTKKALKFVGTCVSGELHEVGIRIISDVLELDGWDTHYLGANMLTDSIVNTVAEINPDLIGISATMIYHLRLVRELIEQLRIRNTNKQVKIIVGGYPFKLDPNLWQKVGADCMAVSSIQLLSSIEAEMGERL